MAEERIAVKLGLREWFAAIGAAGMIVASFAVMTTKLDALGDKLDAFIRAQVQRDERQDAKTDVIEERQVNVRERLRAVDDACERSTR